MIRVRYGAAKICFLFSLQLAYKMSTCLSHGATLDRCLEEQHTKPPLQILLMCVEHYSRAVVGVN